ncbi:MAG TPA: hypothetical protein VFX30_06870 [bacterium]|nr:hypothetical protein [bacterium]
MKTDAYHPILLIALVGNLYGFDWLHQGVSQCETISERMAAGFKECLYYGPGTRGSFTGDADFYTCTVDENSEYMIYKTKERCNQELEVMRSGAP